MDMDDEFDDLYADDMEALRDLEENVNEMSKGKIKNQTSEGPYTPDPSHQKAKHNPPQKARKDLHSKPSLNGSSRKRERVEEIFGPLSSDSESDDLVIDIPPSMTKSPACKKMRGDNDDVSKLPLNGDVEDFEITPPPSPQKGLETLQRIQMERELAQIRAEHKATWSQSQDKGKRAESTETTNEKSRSCILNRQPDGPSITVTGNSGKRVYLRKRDDKIEETLLKNGTMTFDPSSKRVSLLRLSILQLRQQIEEERHEKLILESKQLSKTLNREIQQGADMEDEITPEEENESNLWVDRYAPRHFTDLLSDDGVNRNILFWLKLWDHVVFGTEKKQRSSKSQEVKKQQNKNFNPKFKNFQTDDLSEELDEHNRPVHPIALLCGPPGLGKTTLAHVIAHHAGYNPVEINASDDRSLEVFRNRLESATQMKSVLLKDQRPNCLIIDEVDGSPVPTINYLVNLTKKGESRGGGQKKKKKQQLLQRPIICICNDLYVPALRPLRQIAYVSHFPPTVSARLASRMLQISRDNSLKTDMTTLIALASKTENDIRSCLNTLQFLHRQGKSVNLSMIHSLSVGQKDQHKGLFATWQEIFQLPRPKRKQYTNPHDLEAGRVARLQVEKPTNPASQSSRFHRILSLAMTCGEFAKLTQGIYENYLDVKFKDPHLDSISLASDWLVFTDLLNTRISENQNYSFMRYLPFTPVVFHMLFASVSRPQIKYPNADFECHQKQQRITNHINSMLSGANPRSKETLDLTLAVKDVIPLLQIIIAPTFRPVNTQLFSAQEKKQLSELVNVMIAYNITYHQERNKEGQYNYVLDPNLDEVTRFSDTPITRQMAYGTKQLIAREIETEKLQRKERYFSAVSKSSTVNSKSSKEAVTQSSVPRHKQTLAPKAFDTSENKPVKNFFGRFKKLPPKSRPELKEEKKKEPGERLVTGRLWFQFNQGFTNAVRKTVKMQDML